MEGPTSYPEVNRVLLRLLEEAQEILGEAFVGMYLYGSLATGDFDPRRSDIDFVVVTRNLLPEEMICALQGMHKRFAESDGKWERKLEGLYIPLAELRRHDADGPELPTVNEGQFYLAGQGSDWVLQRHTLREHEAIVAGPSLKEYIDPIDAKEMRGAVCAIMHAWWAPMVGDPAWIEGRPEYQAFTVQTMCRVLYTLQFGTAVSKTAAAAWAMDVLDGQWVILVADAIGWPDSQPKDLKMVQDFIGFTLDQCDRNDD